MDKIKKNTLIRRHAAWLVNEALKDPASAFGRGMAHGWLGAMCWPNGEAADMKQVFRMQRNMSSLLHV